MLKDKFFAFFRTDLQNTVVSIQTCQSFLKVYIEKLLNKIYFKGRGSFEIFVTNRYGHKNL